MKIPFNIPFVSGSEVTYINEVIANKSFSYPGVFSKKCELELSKITGCETVRLTASCTSSLELAALAIDVKEGDEVIVPSFTFVSSANSHNADIFFIKLKDKQQRNELSVFLQKNDIEAYAHYSPLHLSDKGKKTPYFCSTNDYSKTESDNLLRLPLYFDLEKEHVIKVIETLKTQLK